MALTPNSTFKGLRFDLWNLNSALHFHDCNGLRLKGTTHINSPKLHISINGCKDVDIRGVRILAPKDSPNTDGIDISDSTHVNIHHSNIQTGDDCVAINGGVYDVNVTRVFCGPGHGISIGSLGEHGSHDTVEKVRVENCNISGTQNGLRIKTVPYGTGYARGIVFRKIHLVNVENPIIIDQHYCANTENAICPSPPSAPAVQVSDVRFDTQLNSVAVNGGVYDANVTRVFCGPGHGIGISIGSLGENRGRDIVEKVRVEDCNITGTTNGLRIKTVPYGRGYARGIIFRNINLINVKRPIIIDQHYCSNSNSEYAACRSPPSAPAIQVSDVRYENIYGSSATQRAIIFSCSKKYKCIGIQTNRVVITGNNVFVVCKNVEGNFVDTTTPDTCR
ncbi:polygalacturonase-like [Cynara cardunculus var. scolymus]|uniref:polygalacturonase-like n=1 Tax=Cynara cardunculus var. scolymus TaxID=59895 RepID=UPI000D62C3FE|nr:polygalacturonase-like [Cynara cardunculus var. scolymus]